MNMDPNIFNECLSFDLTTVQYNGTVTEFVLLVVYITVLFYSLCYWYCFIIEFVSSLYSLRYGLMYSYVT